MPKSTITVLGVYALPFDDVMIREQADILYGAKLKGAARQEAERRCRKQLSSTVLVELLLVDRSDKFFLGDFTQPQDSYHRDSSQAPWAEAYLSVDGEHRLQMVWPDPPTEKNFRVAFFIHFWNPDVPLLSSYGELQCPRVEPMPERLRRLVPYQLLD